MFSYARGALLFLVILPAGSPALAQEPQEPPDTSAEMSATPLEPQFPPGRRREKDPQQIEMERRQAKALNKQRHEELKSDTEKLLGLAEQLKEYVDKTDENMLSLDVIKKAEEIEKLAKRVREKMKGYYGPVIKP
ncbi:MAG TPA: hypothetical protein VNK82_09210 [Terriglobales bacterium]|nr:hypothetical protein [Terriglobales bacterium]